jgi:hypothetical protein
MNHLNPTTMSASFQNNPSQAQNGSNGQTPNQEKQKPSEKGWLQSAADALGAAEKRLDNVLDKITSPLRFPLDYVLSEQSRRILAAQSAQEAKAAENAKYGANHQHNETTERKDARPLSAATRLTALMNNFKDELIEAARTVRAIEGASTSEEKERHTKKDLEIRQHLFSDRLLAEQLADVLKIPDYLRSDMGYALTYDEKEKKISFIIVDDRAKNSGNQKGESPMIAGIKYDVVRNQLDIMKTFPMPRAR